MKTLASGSSGAQALGKTVKTMKIIESLGPLRPRANHSLLMYKAYFIEEGTVGLGANPIQPFLLMVRAWLCFLSIART